MSKSDSTDETTESEIWKFYNAGEGTVNYAPFPADLLSPTNNEAVSVGPGSVLLHWEVSDIDGDIVSYQVFLGMESPPVTSVGTILAFQHVLVREDTKHPVTRQANTATFWQWPDK
ncbi:MAG: hypothetical protein V7724_14185 [Sediminicola sp.]